MMVLDKPCCYLEKGSLIKRTPETDRMMDQCIQFVTGCAPDVHLVISPEKTGFEFSI